MHYSYKILNQSEQQIFSLEEMKNYARISHDNDDKLLESMIHSAIQMAENFIKISLVKRSIEVISDNSMNIRLPLGPIQEISKILADDVEIPPDDVEIRGEMVHLSKYVGCKRLKIIYSAGYEDVHFIPAPIIEGIKLHVANMYDSRGSEAVSLHSVFALYQPYRNLRL